MYALRIKLIHGGEVQIAYGRGGKFKLVGDEFHANRFPISHDIGDDQPKTPRIIPAVKFILGWLHLR
jgi:hypothetical protein